MSAILRRADPAARGARPLVGVDPEGAGWKYLRFAAYRLSEGEALEGSTGDFETGLVVLGGVCDIASEGVSWERVGGRTSVWEKEKAPVAALLPPGRSYRVTARTGLHLAVAGARAKPEEAVPPRLIGPEAVAAEERGEGRTYRFIRHILPPSAPSARLQLVEVYTPAGNWSSFPPHKHDTEDPPREAYLEETYYYAIHPAEGFALQRVYTADGAFDEAAAAHDGDLVIVPRGFHPVAAMPGYDCYYLNAMAGPAKAWNFTVDPRYAWLMNWKKPEVTEVKGR